MNKYEKLDKFINDNLNKNNYCGFEKVKVDYNRCCKLSFMDAEEESKCFGSPVDNFIDNNKTDDNFRKLLFKFIDDRNLKDSDVYNKVHIDRRLFSKIRSDSMYHPSKETVILLGLSLELNLDDILDLLNSASYSLPLNNVYDLIIRFCFMEGVYDVKDVNDMLDKYHCKMFAY